MKKTITCSLFLILTFLGYGQTKSGYEISISVTGLRDSSIYLGYHYGDKQYIKDTLKLDIKGQGVFKGDNALPQGIYLIVLPGKKFFEMLISDDQYFSLTCKYDDYSNTMKYAGSPENSYFIEYQKIWSVMQQNMSALSKRLQSNKQNNDSIKILSEERLTQEQNMISYLEKVSDENKRNLLGMLVKSIIPVKVPEFTAPSGSQNPDSVKWVLKYNYNKDHYFDNIDLNDERLLRTPILQSRLDAFFKNVVIQSPDSINKEIDKIFAKCEKTYKVFQYVAVFLFNHFRESEIMGHDAVIVKLADDVYLSGKADWITPEFKDDLRKQVELIRNNLIGMRGHDLQMNSYTEKIVDLYDIDKEYTILCFWEPNCGHCKESMPKLKAYYDKAKNENIEVFAICTTDKKDEWKKYIEENKLDWINGWDPERVTHFDYYYNVQSTPMIYILDKNKTIIAKKIGVENIESFIKNHRKYGR